MKRQPRHAFAQQRRKEWTISLPVCGVSERRTRKQNQQREQERERERGRESQLKCTLCVCVIAYHHKNESMLLVPTGHPNHNFLYAIHQQTLVWWPSTVGSPGVPLLQQQQEQYSTITHHTTATTTTATIERGFCLEIGR